MSIKARPRLIRMSTLSEQQIGVAPNVSESGVKTVRKGTRSCTECIASGLIREVYLTDRI